MTAEEFTVSRETNIINSLAGKSSGIQVTRQSGNLGGSTKILIWGVNSLAGNNNPLWNILNQFARGLNIFWLGSSTFQSILRRLPYLPDEKSTNPNVPPEQPLETPMWYEN